MVRTGKDESLYTSRLIEACFQPLICINCEGVIIDLNQAMVNITGIARNKLINSDYFNYFFDQERARNFYKEVFSKGSITDYPLTFRHANFKLVVVIFNGSVYKDANGNVIGAVLVARDISQTNWAFELGDAHKGQDIIGVNKVLHEAEVVFDDQNIASQNERKENREIENKKLEELSYSLELASQYARSLIEASRDPLFTISPDGKITDINNASVNITEMTREQLIGSYFFDYFTEQDKAREIYKQVFSEGFVVDFPLTISDGKLTDVLFNGSVYKDQNEKILGVVVVARDITDQKRIEKELTEAKVFAELATEIAEELKSKAEDATRFAENSVKSKQQFLSNMSHEIRTPMNAIIGFTKVLLKTVLSAKQKEYLSAIKLSGDSLIVLINDILDLAKVDVGKMVFEQIPFNIDASVSAMLHVFETRIQEKNLHLQKNYDKNIPNILIGDPVRLHQIIINLVSNAVKFTNEGEICIKVLKINEDNKTINIEFSVADTGIGIADDKIGHIFENFQQATSNTSRLYGGTGLGLAIAKQLVESQGGSITVKSQLNVGTTFSFILPFNKTNATETTNIESKEYNKSLKNIKVLVVEDIPLNQLLMKVLLDDFGFERDIAENGEIAIEKLKSKKYDIVLMDLHMPIMSGFEATEYIRKEMNLQIPIIALTADVTTVDLNKCRASGMNDYLSKPVDERLLYNKIIEILENPGRPNNFWHNEKDYYQEPKSSSKCIDLTYLKERTKSNPLLMLEMIELYLQQTPLLIDKMKQGFYNSDWSTLYSAVHKLLPSFSIVGINVAFEKMAQKIQDDAFKHENRDELERLILQVNNVCKKACMELQAECNELKKNN